MKTALITGSAGFIGYHTAERWLSEGWRVVGLDAFTEYYDPALKRDRAARLARHPNYVEVEGRVETPGLLVNLLAEYHPDQIIHLAAQAGVRYSIDAPAPMSRRTSRAPSRCWKPPAPIPARIF